MYILIILIQLMYIVFVPFGWIRALSPVCFWFVHNSTKTLNSTCHIYKKYTKIITMPTLQTYFSYIFIKIEADRKPTFNDVWSLRLKLEAFIWCHVVNVTKSSTTFHGILICQIFRPVICNNTFSCSVLKNYKY